jgi:cobalt-zinc-cadmium efflux system outer membrane protein
MRVSLLAAAAGLCVAAAQVQSQPVTPPVAPAAVQTAPSADAARALTLEEAVQIAVRASANVRLREAQLAAAQGLQREAASPLFNNPELSAEQARRRPSGETERTVGLAQAIETGGQQGHRRHAAAANLEALQFEIDDAKRQSRADAMLRFHAVLSAQRRVQIEQRALHVFETTSQAVARRRAAGEDTRLDANVALIEAERARNALAVAQEQLVEARAELAALLQLPAAQLPSVVAPRAPDAPASPGFTLDQLLQAVQGQPKLRALSAREEVARARLGVERGKRMPDVTLGMAVGREGPPGGRERVTTWSVSLPLPLFNRNSAGIGQALTDVGQAEVERSVGVRDSEAQVRRLWLRLSSQRDRVARLQEAILAAARDNQQLATRSRQAGQIGLLDQLVVNRQAIDAERELVEAQTEFENTRIELERAAGWPQERHSQ